VVVVVVVVVVMVVVVDVTVGLSPPGCVCVCCVDVLGDILKKSTAKRSRARVVDKLISMGLVSERRQLYKKRTSSGVPQKRSGKGSGKRSGKGMVRT